MAMPSRIRDELVELCAGRLWLTAHTQERCLLVYPEPEWQNIMPKIQALPTIHPEVRRIQRLFIGQAVNLELDGNGRILVPPTLRDFAHLDKKLMLVGLGNKLELWAEDGWQTLLDQPSQGDLPAELQSLSF